MKSYSKIFLRKATFSDIEFLWYLRNQQDVYEYFKKNQTVPWREHINWILPVILGTSSKIVFVIQKSGIPVGQIRFDYSNLKEINIGISILKEFRGSGVPIKSLDLAIKKARRQKKTKCFVAEINKENLPSIKLFEKLSFKLKTKKGDWLKYSLDL